MMILAFPDYPAPAQQLAQLLEIPLQEIGLHHFPDGESRVRIPVELPGHVLLYRTLFNPNDKLIELMLAAVTAREQGASRITLIAPYLCYMRQDKAFSPGEAISQKIIGRFLANYVDEVITVDPHLHRITSLEQAIPATRALACSAARLIADHIQQQIPAAFLVGPDIESTQWLQKIAGITAQEYVVAEKQRSGDRKVAITLPEFGYHNRRAVIIDDIASTGRTIAATTRQLLDRGVASVDMVVTHALFKEDAEQHLRNAGVRNIWSTDSIPHGSNAISLAPVLAQAVNDNLL